VSEHLSVRNQLDWHAAVQIDMVKLDQVFDDAWQLGQQRFGTLGLGRRPAKFDSSTY